MNKRQPTKSKAPSQPRTKKVAYAKPSAFVNARAGQLAMRYGRDDGGDTGIAAAWGEGCDKADANLLHEVISTKRCGLSIFGTLTWEPSLLNELERRGYDLKTLEFSIQKKA